MTRSIEIMKGVRHFFTHRLSIKPVSVLDTSVIELIEQLNTYQIGLYGIERCNLESPESLHNHSAYMVGAYSGDILVGIGAIKLFDSFGEIKRMFVLENFRGMGISERILYALEDFAVRNGITKLCLETGRLQRTAIRLYKKCGYIEIERFGGYHPNDVSIYFERLID